MKHFLLFTTFIISFVSNFAQENFVPARIILHNADTLEGVINASKIDLGPSIVLFKRSGSGDIESYLPGTIRGFVVGERIFTSAVVDRNVEPLLPLPETAEFHFEIDTVFLELVVSGERSLAAYKGMDGVLNLYVFDQDRFELLKYKKYIKTNSDGRTFVAESNLYRAQLMGYLGECKQVSQKANTIRYTVEDMQKLFYKYYACRNLSTSYVKSLERPKQEFGLFVGFDNTKLSFKGGSTYAAINYSSSTSFTGGVFFNLGLQRKLRDFSIQNELQYTSFIVEGSTRDLRTAGGSENFENHRLGGSYLRLNTLARYKVEIGKGGLYLNLGVTNGFAFDKVNEGEIVWMNNGQVTKTEKTKAVPDYRSYERAFVYGLGAYFNRVFIDVRQERSKGFSLMLNTTSIISRNVVFLGYRL